MSYMRTSKAETLKCSNARQIWPVWPLQITLAVLLLGPLAAPLFQASGVAPMAGAGALARDMLAQYICPTPAKSYDVLGFPMAVCARCWGATIGLWVAWLLLGQAATAARAVRAWLGWYLALPWLAR